MGRHLIIRQQHRYRQQTATNCNRRLQTTYDTVTVFRLHSQKGNVADATHPASTPIADARKMAPAPGAGAVAIFLDVGCCLLPMARFCTVSGNGTRHRWKRVNPTTGYSPFQVNTGRVPNLPVDLISLPTVDVYLPEAYTYATDLTDLHQRVHDKITTYNSKIKVATDADKSQILVIKHIFVMNFLCNPLYLFACFIYNLA